MSGHVDFLIIMILIAILIYLVASRLSSSKVEDRRPGKCVYCRDVRDVEPVTTLERDNVDDPICSECAVRVYIFYRKG